MGEPCISYREGSQICADGFPIKPLCSGRAGCVTCGAISDASLPVCLRDDGLAPHLVDDAGLPRLAEYRRAALASPAQQEGEER